MAAPPVCTGPIKRVCKLLIGKGGFCQVPPPRVFSKKRLQVIENKGRGAKKERKEAATVCRERIYFER